MTERRRLLQRLELSRQAVRLFCEQGVAATSGEQIADALGLSVRTLWRYFPTKESCVEPLLSESLDLFTAVLRSWPPHRSLAEHITTEYHASANRSTEDGRAVLGILRLARDEPAIRAIWLLANQRTEPVFAEIIASRTGRSADDLAVRVQASAVNAALRIATEDLARRDDTSPEPDKDGLALLATAMEVALHGLPEKKSSPGSVS
jgi:AcrR family transcriptional regulator